MTTSTKAPAPATPATGPERRKFTVAEYYRLAEAGILLPDERVQLIDGEIIVMPPIGPLHATTVGRWHRVFNQRIEGPYSIHSQSPIRIGDGSEPEPDVAIVRFREDDYSSAHPGPADVLLVIEVSNTTLAFDREVKVNLYADAQIPETWLMNLPDDCIEGFTEPGPEGYARHVVYRRGDRIAPAALPDVEFAVDDLLPPLPREAEQPPESAGETPTSLS